MNARKTAFSALKRVSDTAYSNIALDNVLRSSELDERDRRLAAGIFYGVLENEQLLDYIISGLLSKPGMKLEKDVRLLLRMGLYQLTFMDKIPESAAVNETVSLAGKCGLSRASGLINGMLRSYIRSGKKPVLPERSSNELLYLSIKYSCPQWIIELWIKDYGLDVCEKILKCLSGRPPLYMRINTAHCTAESAAAELEAEGVSVSPVEWLNGAAAVSSTGGVENLHAYLEGHIFVQDIASQLCCLALDPQPGETVLDVCAAPGGKSFTSACLMGDSGRVVSCDIYPHRVRLIDEGAKRLHLESVVPVVRDALTGEVILADRVLCDVPCSGLGIIRRKPDIRSKSPKALAQLPDLQYDILCRSAESVRRGGVLVYSTCTLCSAENSAVVDKFLHEHPDFEPFAFSLPDKAVRTVRNEPEHMLTLFPFCFDSDGFFIARMKRKG